jgi:hypothetical protein
MSNYIASILNYDTYLKSYLNDKIKDQILFSIFDYIKYNNLTTIDNLLIPLKLSYQLNNYEIEECNKIANNSNTNVLLLVKIKYIPNISIYYYNNKSNKFIINYDNNNNNVTSINII